MRVSFSLLASLALFLLMSGLAAAAETNTTLTETPSAEWTWKTVYVCVLIVVMVVALVLEVVPATPAMVMSAMMLYLPGIVETADLFVGLSNNGVVSVAILFIIVKPMADLPAMKKLLILTLSGDVASPMWPLFKLVALSLFISPFVENTPHVAMFTPLITKFCAENGLSAAQFLMPMDFAVIGSNYAVVGAGSNLVISGLMEDNDLGAMEFFELGKGTVMVLPFMLVYLTLAPAFLLSKEPTTMTSGGSSTGALRMKLRVTERSKEVIGRKACEMGSIFPGEKKPESFRVLGLYRGGVATAEDKIPETVMEADDIFVVACDPKMVISTASVLQLDFITANDNSAFSQVDMYSQDKKIASTITSPTSNEPVEESEMAEKGDTAEVAIVNNFDNIKLWEVVLSPNCPLINSPIKAQAFQRYYAASILAVRTCAGQMDLEELEMPSYRLAAGDTLLMLAGVTFENDYHATHDFLVITGYHSSIDSLRPFIFIVPSWAPFGVLTDENSKAAKRIVMLPWWWPNLSFVIFVAIVIAAVFHIPLSVLCLGGAILYVLLGLVTTAEAIKAIHVDVYVMIAFSFPLGISVKKSGLAQIIGQGINDANITGFNLLLVISVITVLMTNLISNKATCQVMFPITLAAARLQGMDPIPAIVVMTMASVYAFLTPYAIPPNVLIMGPGKYRPIDYFKFGFPLAVILAVLTPLSASIVYNVW